MEGSNASSPPLSATSTGGPKRRLSDASSSGNPEKKVKKLIGADGKPLDSGAAAAALADGTNKTKTGRFKPGAPVDLDEQCGVVQDGKGPCSRSLTCKTHGMASKRAVEGRSMSYDEALTAFNRRKEAKGILPKKKQDKSAKADQSASNDNIAVPSSAGGSGSTPLSKQSSIASSTGLHFPGDGGTAQAYAGNAPGANPAPASGSASKSQSSSSKPPQTQLKAGVQAQLDAAGTLKLPGAAGKPAAPAISAAKPASATSTVTKNGTTKPKSSNTSAAGSQAMNQSATGPPGTSTAGVTAAGAPKKKSTTDKKRTTGKSTKASKADLILGEVDDPPEAPSAATADPNGPLVLEEEAPDSDDELEQLLMAVGKQSRPRPLSMHAGLTLDGAGRAGGRHIQRYRESFVTAFTGRSLAAKSAG